MRSAEEGSGTLGDLTRRALVVSSAWAVPAVSISVAIPAHAAASEESSLTVTLDGVDVLRGCMIRATALVRDAASNPVVGRSVVFSVDASSMIVGSNSVTTDSTGRASVLIDIGVTTTAGSHPVTATGGGGASSTAYSVVASPASASFDWRGRAVAYDAFVYDWSQPGEFPTIGLDSTHRNIDVDTWKMPSYYGQPLPGDGGQEAVTLLPSLVGATLVGIDKSAQDGRDYVDMARTFFQPHLGVALNNPASGDGGADSFWYAATANLMLSAIAMLYPKAPHYDDIFRSIADKHSAMVEKLGGASADFTGQGFDFASMSRSRGSRNEGGDAAAATALILLWAHDRFGDARYLDGARWALGYLDRSSTSLNYEWATMLMPFAAARMNATAATMFDLRKMLMFVLQQSTARPGWGTLSGTWAGYDVYGLQGSVTDGGGYAFALNSFATAFLAPAIKYDVRYAGVVGPLLANVANAARFFYPDQVSTTKQIYGTRFAGSPAAVVAYEGFRAREAGVSPRATGDPSAYGKQWGLPAQTTDLGLYGAGWVGIFASTVEVVRAGLTRIDVDALDLGSSDGLRRSLWVNTGLPGIDVTIPVSGPRALYDVLTDTVLTNEATGEATIALPQGASRLVVEMDPHPHLDRTGGVTRVEGSIVNYRAAVSDFAAGRTVAASSAASGFSPQNVVDGDASTAWEAQDAWEQWVSIDLSQIRFVTDVEIDWLQAAAMVRVEVSTDGSSWTSAASAAVMDQTQYLLFPAVFARFVRLAGLTPSTGNPVAISAVRVRSRDLAARAMAIASTSVNANTAALVTDGDDMSRWESATTDPQWIVVDLERTRSVGRVLLWWETASAKAYRIEVSGDMQSWETVSSTSAGPGGRETIVFPAVEARFVRVFCTQRNTRYAYSIIALGVFEG